MSKEEIEAKALWNAEMKRLERIEHIKAPAKPLTATLAECFKSASGENTRQKEVSKHAR